MPQGMRKTSKKRPLCFVLAPKSDHCGSIPAPEDLPTCGTFLSLGDKLEIEMELMKSRNLLRPLIRKAVQLKNRCSTSSEEPSVTQLNSMNKSKKAS